MGKKRKRHFVDDPANLKRFRDEIMHLPDSTDSRQFVHSKSDFFPGKKKLPRKMKRKEERHLKKARRLAYSQRKPMPKAEDEAKKKLIQKQEEKKKLKMEKQKKKKKKTKEKKKQRIQQEEETKKEEMFAAIQKEERTIKQLEKSLHLNKRKSKTLPQSFLDDGLDYLLDVVDKEKVSALYDESEDEEDLAKLGEDSDSNQELSDVDEETTMKKQTIDEIMSHLKNAKSILKNSKSETGSKEKSKVTFQTEDEPGSDLDSGDEEDEDNDLNSGDEMFDDDLSDEDDNLNENNDDKEEIEDRYVLQMMEKKNSKKNDKGKLLENDSNEDEDLGFSEDEESSGDESYSDEKLLGSEGEDQDDIEEEGEESGEEEENSKKGEVTKEHSGKISGAGLKEDIYGRLRDAKGNVVTMTTGSYVPPAKRLAMAGTLDEKKKLKLERLKKQLKGLVNRASDANMGPITSQLETIFTSNSRGDVNESLCDIIMESTITEVLTPERLAMEMMMMVAILNDNIGMEVGGLFIQQLAHQLRALWDENETKALDNVVLLFAHLYNFKVIHCVLIFDLIKKFVERFTEKDIELILLLLKNVGFNLRKDDPHTLKDIILMIQGKANSKEITDSTRVKFMLEVLLAIKNNNMRKIPNYDPEKFEELKKSARNHVKGSLGTNQLRISLEDLMNAEDKGRWWVIGSAWEGRSDKQDQVTDVSEVVKTTVVGEMSNKILELARKQRMNTETRKNIFCVIMTSEDYVDAFEKLLRLGLKNQQEREIIHVITDCSINEKSYNPFYSFLLQKFCEYDRRFQMTFQFMLWDKFKEMSHQTEQGRSHLAKLVSHLLSTQAISLSVFKVVEFGTLDKSMVRFLKQVLQEILLDNSDQVVQDVFCRIAPLTKLHLLHEGLKLFMRHFIIGKKSKQDQNRILQERVTLAEKALSMGQTKFEL